MRHTSCPSNSTFPTLIVDLFVYLIIVGALLPNYESFVQWLKRLSPLDDALEDLFLRKIGATVRSMFAGIFLIAIVQGVAMGFFLAGGSALHAVVDAGFHHCRHLWRLPAGCRRSQCLA